MNKKITFLLLLLTAFVGLTACSGDDNDLEGYWATAPWAGYWDQTCISAYHFINDNTVRYYSDLNDRPNVNTDGKTIKIKGKTWYPNAGNGQSYTYTREGNKVIIPMQGVILTISGKTMTKDGSILTYTKQ